MRWPFSRRRQSPAAEPRQAADAAEAKAPEVQRADWASLPPIQRAAADPIELTAESGVFFHQLAATNQPASPHPEPLGHDVTMEAPAGIATGLARPATTRTDVSSLVHRLRPAPSPPKAAQRAPIAPSAPEVARHEAPAEEPAAEVAAPQEEVAQTPAPEPAPPPAQEPAAVKQEPVFRAPEEAATPPKEPAPVQGQVARHEEHEEQAAASPEEPEPEPQRAPEESEPEPQRAPESPSATAPTLGATPTVAPVFRAVLGPLPGEKRTSDAPLTFASQRAPEQAASPPESAPPAPTPEAPAQRAPETAAPSISPSPEAAAPRTTRATVGHPRPGLGEPLQRAESAPQAEPPAPSFPERTFRRIRSSLNVQRAPEVTPPEVPAEPQRAPEEPQRAPEELQRAPEEPQRTPETPQRAPEAARPEEKVQRAAEDEPAGGGDEGAPSGEPEEVAEEPQRAPLVGETPSLTQTEASPSLTQRAPETAEPPSTPFEFARSPEGEEPAGSAPAVPAPMQRALESEPPAQLSGFDAFLARAAEVSAGETASGPEPGGAAPESGPVVRSEGRLAPRLDLPPLTRARATQRSRAGRSEAGSVQRAAHRPAEPGVPERAAAVQRAPLPLVGSRSLRGIQRSTEEVPADVHTEVGRHLSEDLSGVKVHRSPETAKTAGQIQARAFTTRGEIHLPDHQGPLDREPARSLVAHELVHVSQQRKLGASLPTEDSAHGRVLEAQAQSFEHAARSPQRAPQQGPSLVYRTPTPDAVAALATTRQRAGEPGSAAEESPLNRGARLGPQPIDAASGLATGRPRPVFEETNEQGERLDPASGLAMGRARPESTEHAKKAGMDAKQLAEAYEYIRTRLKQELLIDRERAGLLSDLM